MYSLARSWRVHKMTLTSSVYYFAATKNNKMFSAAAKEYNIASLFTCVAW